MSPIFVRPYRLRPPIVEREKVEERRQRRRLDEDLRRLQKELITTPSPPARPQQGPIQRSGFHVDLPDLEDPGERSLRAIAEGFAPERVGPQRPEDVERDRGIGARRAREFAGQAQGQEAEIVALRQALEAAGATPEEFDQILRFVQSRAISVRRAPPTTKEKLTELVPGQGAPFRAEVFDVAPDDPETDGQRRPDLDEPFNKVSQAYKQLTGKELREEIGEDAGAPPRETRTAGTGTAILDPANQAANVFRVEQEQIASRTRGPITAALRAANVPGADTIGKFTAEVFVPTTFLPFIGQAGKAGKGLTLAQRIENFAIRGAQEGAINLQQDVAGRAERGEEAPSDAERAFMFAAGAVFGGAAPEFMEKFGTPAIKVLLREFNSLVGKGVPAEEATARVIADVLDENGAIDPEFARIFGEELDTRLAAAQGDVLPDQAVTRPVGDVAAPPQAAVPEQAIAPARASPAPTRVVEPGAVDRLARLFQRERRSTRDATKSQISREIGTAHSELGIAFESSGPAAVREARLAGREITPREQALAELGDADAIARLRDLPRIGGGSGGADIPQPLSPERFGEPEQFVPGRGGRFEGFEELPEVDVVQGLQELGVDDALVRGTDDVADALNRLAHPATRTAEGAARRVPVAVRAQRARDQLSTLANRKFETIEDSVARWGDRYKGNLFTWFDDVTAGVRGVDRKAQGAVRDLNVEADIYRANEGGMADFRVLEWVGRNKEVLGLDAKGRATAVSARPGAKVPKSAAQRIDDIWERSGDYILSPEQQRAMSELYGEDGLMGEMLLLNQRAGIDIEQISGPYAPHVVLDSDTAQIVTGQRIEGLSARPWFSKTRAFPTVREALVAGKKVADPVEAARSRLSGGVEHMANRHIADGLKSMGYTPKERVSETLAEELRVTRTAHQEARALAVKTGAMEDRVAARFAETKLVDARRAVRIDAEAIKQRSPKLFGRIVSEDVLNEASRYVNTVQPSSFEEFSRIYRALLVTADYSSLGIQNWSLMYRDPAAFLKAAALATKTLKEAPYDYMARHGDTIPDMIRYGFLRSPSEFLLSQGGSVSRRVGQLPGLKQGQRLFEWNVFIGQHQFVKGMLQGKNFTEKELLDLASVVTKRQGSTLMPGMTVKQARTMTGPFGLFAPKFYAAIHGALIDPLTKSGAARTEAVKGMLAAFGGAASLTVAASLAFTGKMPNMDDPNAPGYWQIRAGNRWVSLFGPYKPMIDALGKTAAGDRFAVPRYIEGKASVPARWLIRGLEAAGLPISKIRGESFLRPDRGLTLGDAPLPIGPRAVGESIAEGDFNPLDILEVGGGRVRPVSTFTQWKEAQSAEFERQRDAGQIPDITVDGVTRPPKDYAELRRHNRGATDAIDQTPSVQEALSRFADKPPRDDDDRGRFFDELEVSREEQRTAQVADNDQLRQFFRSGGDSGLSPKTWDDAAAERASDFFNQREGLKQAFPIDFKQEEGRDPPGSVNAAVDDYYDVNLDDYTELIEGERVRDWGAYTAAQDRALANLTTQNREAALAVIRKNKTPLERQFLELLDEVDEYYDQEIGSARERWRRRNNRGDAILYLTGQVTTLIDAGSEREAETIARRIFGTGAEIPSGVRRAPTRRRRSGDLFSSPF